MELFIVCCVTLKLWVAISNAYDNPMTTLPLGGALDFEVTEGSSSLEGATCAVKSCQKPHLRSGKVECTNDDMIGSICRFTCDRHHILVGRDVTECVPNSGRCDAAIWTPDVPFCRPLFCPNLPSIRHGRLICTRGFKLGSYCTYQCDGGAIMDPPEHDGRFCYKNATWIGENEPICFIPSQSECLMSSADKGPQYRGHITKTASGLPCQRWDSQFPHKHSRTPARHPGFNLEGNYCRNPDNELGPWCYTTDPNVRFELCNVPVCPDQCLAPQGSFLQYEGRVDRTRSNLVCQKWSEQFPHQHQHSPEKYPDLVSNFCRNPNNNLFPWCYTTDPDVVWEYCEIPACPVLCLASQFDTGLHYRGNHAVTQGGIPCQAWESQTPHHHSRIPENFPSYGLEANYCRNPDNEARIWCYTTNPDVRWDYCDVPICSNDISDQCLAAVYKRGIYYRGTHATTITGTPCQAWEVQNPHEHNFSPENNPNTGLEGNYCRNPDNRPAIWCYTTDPEVPWEYCALSMCEVDCLTARNDSGMHYRGDLAITQSGISCQPWGSQRPHEHNRTPGNHPVSGLEENYCRNPNDSAGVWCFTSDPAVRWEYCDAPVCTANSSDDAN